MEIYTLILLVLRRFGGNQTTDDVNLPVALIADLLFLVDDDILQIWWPTTVSQLDNVQCFKNFPVHGACLSLTRGHTFSCIDI